MPPRHRLAALLTALLAAAPAGAAGPPAGASFRDDIYPLLSARCLRCHKGTNPTSGVRLDARAELLGETNGRPLAVPGQAATSRLIRAIAGHDPDKRMPPEGRGKRLTDAEVALFRRWVDQGLRWDDKLLPPPAAPDHWSFRPVRRPAVPTADGRFPVRTPIDAFLAAAWKARGLTPVAPASRRALLRRVTLDLTGLPPTPDEIDAFERDARPDAYERVVDRLLASPRHGERYGRHWLDLARYADSEGYESNHPRPHAWRYRDWVTNAFNADTPFADFARAQLAGDELRPYRDDNLIATGFLAAARLSSNEEDRARQRNDVLVDVVNTTAGAFLGLTMHCAQCHNHKFDPITARDYYRLQAFFARGYWGNLALKAPGLERRWRAALPAGYLDAKRRQEELSAEARRRLTDAALAAMPDDERRVLRLPPDQRTLAEERLARVADVKLQFGTSQIEREVTRTDRKEYEALKKKLAAWEKAVPDRPQTWGFYAPATAAAKLDVLRMKGFYPPPFEPGKLVKLRAHLLAGGEVHQVGPALEPGWPAVFGPTPATLSPTPRQALADWVVSPRNPLAARVWANRVWGWHFGQGLVRTPSDFGTKGARPTHPELLDWLASELLASGGRTKPLHRLIVLSHAYQMAATSHAGNAKLDPDNRLLWRWAPRRLEAEAIRDSLLAVTGELAPRVGGAPDADEAASRRRGTYLLQKRDVPPMVQGLFDGPSASAESCPLRGTSTVPLQALYLLNNSFSRGRAEALAKQLRAEATGRDAQAAAAFRRVLGRAPDDAEKRALGRFFDRHGEEGALAALCQALMNLNEFVYLE